MTAARIGRLPRRRSRYGTLPSRGGTTAALHRPEPAIDPISTRAPVLYRDVHLVALDKPAGVSLLADRSGAPCLWNALPALIDGKPYLVHRLDKGTSGVLLVARDQRTPVGGHARVRPARRAQVLPRVGDRRSRLCGHRSIDLPLRPGRKSRYRVAGPREAIVRSRKRWTLTKRDPEGLDATTRLRVLARAQARPRPAGAADRPHAPAPRAPRMDRSSDRR